MLTFSQNCIFYGWDDAPSAGVLQATSGACSGVCAAESNGKASIADHPKEPRFNLSGQVRWATMLECCRPLRLPRQLAVVFFSAAPGPIRWHYRQKINALVYQAIVE